MRRKGTAGSSLILGSAGLVVCGLIGLGTLTPFFGDGDREIKSLSTAEREELAKKRERFERLSAEEKNRYRQLHRELEGHEDSERLTRVLMNYHAFLESLTSIERAKLADLPMEERIEEIQELKRRHDWRAFNRLAEKSVTQKDLEVLFDWINEVAVEHETLLSDQLFSLNPDFDAERIPSDVRDRRRFWTGFLIGQIEEDTLKVPTDAEIEELGAMLSPSAQEFLNSDSDRQGKLRRLRGWLFVGWMSRRRNTISEEELEKFFNEQLSDEERHTLDQKSPEDRMDLLREMYVKRRMNRGRRGGPPPGGRGGAGFPPPRGNDNGPPPEPPRF